MQIESKTHIDLQNFKVLPPEGAVLYFDDTVFTSDWTRDGLIGDMLYGW